MPAALQRADGVGSCRRGWLSRWRSSSRKSFGRKPSVPPQDQPGPEPDASSAPSSISQQRKSPLRSTPSPAVLKTSAPSLSEFDGWHDAPLLVRPRALPGFSVEHLDNGRVRVNHRCDFQQVSATSLLNKVNSDLGRAEGVLSVSYSCNPSPLTDVLQLLTARCMQSCLSSDNRAAGPPCHAAQKLHFPAAHRPCSAGFLCSLWLLCSSRMPMYLHAYNAGNKGQGWIFKAQPRF